MGPRGPGCREGWEQGSAWASKKREVKAICALPPRPRIASIIRTWTTGGSALSGSLGSSGILTSAVLCFSEGSVLVHSSCPVLFSMGAGKSAMTVEMAMKTCTDCETLKDSLSSPPSALLCMLAGCAAVQFQTVSDDCSCWISGTTKDDCEVPTLSKRGPTLTPETM